MESVLPAAGAALYVSAEGRADPGHPWDAADPIALLPGAFNPVHAGHLGLAQAATAVLGLPVALELSIANVDKPPLTDAEVRRRLAALAGRSAVWLSHAPRFLDKAELFPGAVFVVGADTAARVIDPRYYGDDVGRMHHALNRLRERRCRFLVACRAAGGRCVALADLPVPAASRDLFLALPAERFRLDLSSTEVRAGTRGVGIP